MMATFFRFHLFSRTNNQTNTQTNKENTQSIIANGETHTQQGNTHYTSSNTSRIFFVGIINFMFFCIPCFFVFNVFFVFLFSCFFVGFVVECFVADLCGYVDQVHAERRSDRATERPNDRPSDGTTERRRPGEVGVK